MEPDDTRERLLCAAMDTFAAQGYHAASTRDICRAAEAGNAAIHYHFGDKAAIYRELYIRLLERFEQRMRGADVEGHSGREALLAYYEALLQPLAEDSRLAQQVYLHLREEFQPTGIVDDLQSRGLKVQFDLLGGALQRELRATKLDGAMQRLVLSLHGISLIYIVKRRAIDATLPGLMEGPNWLHRLAGHLADQGWSMIETERKRRAATARKRLQAA